MKPVQEITLKILIFVLVLILLVVEVFFIDINIRIIEIAIKIIALVLLLVIIIVEIRNRTCHAFIYQHKENGTFQYCSNDQGEETRDFRKVGEGEFPCEQVGRCSFAR